ncbi:MULTISPECIES: small acid-soluble spore protein Tlp [Brevibacillus]|jgi:small acid-soluble spore protein (thioredoxin-like protein)|uniref:small acid-soluble spore protein Tlp n=1 Tax=Brevibacillus TaxID=55080 RepID=UPI000F07E2C0|nr:small acid-soluble spore protein Tlp [Brevibacillus borstelensis]MED1885087.1 small acid-soluble spore protein Tlp [Brevibacillus borstelensis]RNB55475.1 small acid-soluble spore protein Tlp [Brevibacillus borstelensis]GED54416.1 small, acid-soluble spore protein Tlp [Brevibacillus borstelensis]
MAKPDNRSDNVEKLQEMIQNSMENMRETCDYLNAHGDEISAEEKANLQQKNERREESIEGFRSEIKDEASQME